MSKTQAPIAQVTRHARDAMPGQTSSGSLKDGADLIRTTWRVDVSDAVELPGRFEIAVDLVAPSEGPGHDDAGDTIVLACLPGGFLSRKYFDLEVDGSRTYSFAEAMAHAGFITLAFDHIGVGESSKPDPVEGGYALGVEEIARANQRALEIALGRVADGDASIGLRRRSRIRTIGVGHSMGSALTVEQQALYSPHAALVLFSFTTRGVPRFLSESQAAVAHDPERARASLARLARETMGSPYPPSAADSEENRVAAFGVGTAPASAEEALHRASTNLLAMGGLLSMIPGAYTPSANKIDVPTLVALGDHDLHDEEGLAEMLPAAPEVSVCVLDDCWHCHFVANTRTDLFTRTADWLREKSAGPTAGP